MSKLQHNTMRRLQAGYSLIELLVTVTIVGVLASIALPMYLNYTTRAKVSELLSVASSAQLAVVESRMDGGTFPSSNDMAGIPEPITSTNVESLLIGNNGVITVKGNSVALGLPATTILALRLTPKDNNDSTVSWTCAVTDSDLNKYVPRNCRVGKQAATTG